MRMNFLFNRSLFLMALFFVLSCHKQEHLTAPETDNLASPIIEQAKNWFTQNGSQANARNKPSFAVTAYGQLAPQWTKARIAQDPFYEVVEIPVRFEHNPGLRTVADESTEKPLSRSVLLVLKDKTTHAHKAALMQIVADNGASLEEVHYRQIPKTFTGYVFYTDLNGQFINGWRYQNGSVIASSSNRQSNTDLSGKALPEDTECRTVTTLWFVQDCNYYTDGSYECTDWQYIGSTSENYCPTGGGGGGDGGVNDGEVELEPDLEYTCPENFTFVSVTTNNLWQEARLTNIFCTVAYYDAWTGERISRQVTIPSLYFGLAYYNANGDLVFSQNQAKATAADALNQAEYEMRNYFKHNLTATADQLQSYWIERTNYWMKQLTGNRGSATKQPSLNPTNTPPARPYIAC